MGNWSFNAEYGMMSIAILPNGTQYYTIRSFNAEYGMMSIAMYVYTPVGGTSTVSMPNTA